jgi:hypothetical protein
MRLPDFAERRRSSERTAVRAALEAGTAPDEEQERLRRSFLARLDEGRDALRRRAGPPT